MKPPRLSIVVVSWNTKDLLLKCLDSIAQTYRKPHEIILVDNASDDESVTCVRAAYPLVKIIENPDNRGFGRACNQAFRAACGENLLCLNPDTVVQPGAIERMVQFLDRNGDIGLVGPMLLNPDNSLQPSCRNFLTNKNLFLQHVIPRKGVLCRLSNALVLEYWEHDRVRDVDWIIGACLMIRRNVLERVGSFDDDFPHFHEDTDLCYRIHKSGLRVVFFPEAKVVHYGGVSSSKRWGDETILQYYRAKHIFIRKHYGKLHLFLHKALISIFFLMQAFHLRLTSLRAEADDRRRKRIEFLKKALRMQWGD